MELSSFSHSRLPQPCRFGTRTGRRLCLCRKATAESSLRSGRSTDKSVDLVVGKARPRRMGRQPFSPTYSALVPDDLCARGAAHVSKNPISFCLASSVARVRSVRGLAIREGGLSMPRWEGLGNLYLD